MRERERVRRVCVWANKIKKANSHFSGKEVALAFNVHHLKAKGLDSKRAVTDVQLTRCASTPERKLASQLYKCKLNGAERMALI